MSDEGIFGWRAVKAIYDLLDGGLGTIGRLVLKSGSDASELQITNGAAMVGAGSIQVSASPTISTSAYTVGTCLGSIITFTGALRAGKTGILQKVKIVDTDNLCTPLELLLFNSNPTVGTYTDKSVPVFGTDYSNKVIARIPVNASDYKSIGTPLIGGATVLAGDVLTGDSNGNIYGLLVTDATPTPTHATAFTAKLDILRD